MRHPSVSDIGQFTDYFLSLKILNAAVGRPKPLRCNSPKGSASTKCSTLLRVFWSVKIWPPLASEERR